MPNDGRLTIRTGLRALHRIPHPPDLVKLLVLNGPNLNLLGVREPERYGRTSLDDLAASLEAAFPDYELAFFQSNHEGALIDRLHEARVDGTAGVVFNPGGYGHTSVAIRDAVAAIGLPVVEVHITNVHAREEFRHRSLIAPVCTGQISGLGTAGYHLAIRYLADHLHDR
jgi:3-dehydroquinate dehydratase II